MPRIVKDLRNVHFLPIKCIYFLFFGGALMLSAYNPLYMKSIGLTAEESALVHTFIPLQTCFTLPLGGALADKIGNFKNFMSLLFTFTGFINLAYQVIPVARRTFPGANEWTFQIISDLENSSCTSLYVSNENDTCRVALSKLRAHFEDRNIDDSFLRGERKIKKMNAETGETFTFQVSDYEKDAELILEFETFSNHLEKYETINRNIYENNSNLSCGNLEHLCPSSSHTQACRSSIFLKTDHAVQERQFLSFLLYASLRSLHNFVGSIAAMLVQGACQLLVLRHNGDIGLQTLWMTIGTIVFLPTVGFMIDKMPRRENDVTDFSPLFLIASLIYFVCSIIVLHMDLRFQKSSQHLLKDLRSVFRQRRILVFLMVVLFRGSLFGIMDNVIFLYASELGATKSMLGISVALARIASIPLLLTGSYLIHIFGHVSILNFGLLTLSLKLFCLGQLQNARYFWLISSLDGICGDFSSLFTMTLSSYIASLSTPSTMTTIRGIVYGLYWGLGRAVGGFTSGILINFFGMKKSLLILSISSVVVAALYTGYHFNLLPIMKNKKEEEEKDQSYSQRMKFYKGE